MEEQIRNVGEYLMQYGLNILAAIVIFFVGRWIAKLISGLVEAIIHKSKLDRTLATFVKDLVYFGIMVFVIIAAVNKLGVETTSLVAIIGAAGLAVGLALQGSLANFAAGVLLIILKPFRVGDLVDVAGILGTVEQVKIFNTFIHTLDNKCVIVPNASITSGNIINLSVVDKRRVDLVFGISYGDDMKAAKNALQSVVEKHPKVLKDPAPTIAVSELGDSSVNLVCRPWCKPEDYWTVHFDVVEQGKLALEAAGITIPFPQRDVHLYQDK